MEDKTKHCVICGKPFEPNCNRHKYCKECKVEVTREQARLRQQKHRERKSTLKS